MMKISSRGVKIVFFYISALLIITGCSSKEDSRKKGEAHDKVQSENRKDAENEEDNRNVSEKSYDLSYFSGEAEISTYTVNKARYEGMHPGETVLIFVTEPFLINEQVKADNPQESNTAQVLKMNRIDRFSTGVYDYSIMTSVFTPTEKFSPEFPLKITFGNQDWCGQSFTQVNNRNGFEIMERSYFESEGDTSYSLNYSITEDNLFNLARIDTALLPQGEFELIPSLAHTRLAHIELKPYTATASLTTFNDQVVYSYDIPSLKRAVRIFMNPAIKMEILRWEETYPTIFDGKLRTSEYTLKHTQKLPYWKKNKSTDAELRDVFEMECLN